jgi:hypothetical protein
MSLKPVLGNAVLLVFSVTLALIVSEAGARLFLNPADYLSVQTVRDEVLGIRIASGSAGFDDLGFRNAGVPAKADLLAIGDSHTFGNNAAMSESWPAVVGSMTGRDVYNLGLGGYGPNQYYELLRRHISRLNPRWVLCGLYMGDDFENAYLMTYGRDYWSWLRAGNWTNADADIWETTDDSTWHQRARLWLSLNSIVYRLVIHGPVIGRLKGFLQLQRAARDESVTTLASKETGVHEAFRPLSLRSRLDQRSPIVREGMRITFELLRSMDQLSRDHGARLAVVIIPTKETVFADRLLNDPATNLRDDIEQLVRDEKAATQELLTFLDETGIPHIEPLDALRSRVSENLYTPSDRDMHPNANGYRVIGETVAQSLTRGGSTSASVPAE